MPKPNIKTGFYKQYQAEQQALARQPIGKPEPWWKQLLTAITWTLRVLFYLALFVLSSVGATALVNEPIRDLMLKTLFPN